MAIVTREYALENIKENNLYVFEADATNAEVYKISDTTGVEESRVMDVASARRMYRALIRKGYTPTEY